MYLIHCTGLQAVAYFTGRASSAQNQYSQCLMMLKCWRGQIKPEELQVRLCDALQRIRRIDLAVKVGAEMAGESKRCDYWGYLTHCPSVKRVKQHWGVCNWNFLAGGGMKIVYFRIILLQKCTVSSLSIDLVISRWKNDSGEKWRCSEFWSEIIR